METEDLCALATRVGEALTAANMRVTVAESCTGGELAAVLTAVPGCSHWLERGFVTYSNDAKVEMLGVDPATIAHNGAVSQPTALEMAAGALRHSHAQVAVSITGLAGPGGGTVSKPVGTVCFGFAVDGREPQTEMRFFAGNRAAIRRQSVAHALHGLLARVPHA